MATIDGNRYLLAHGVHQRDMYLRHALSSKSLERSIRADKATHEVIGRCDQDFIRRSGLLEPSGAKDRDAVCHLDRLVDVMAHQQYRLFELLLHSQELVLDGRAVDGVDGAERLVHQKHRWVGREGARHTHALLLTARELVGVTPQKLSYVKSHHVQQFGSACARACPIPAEQARYNPDIFLYRHVWKQPHLLDHIADASAQRHCIYSCRVLVVDKYTSAGRGNQPVDHAHCGGLAAT